jgi:hypothetical protein
VPLFWSRKRTIVEWLAAQYRDMVMLPPDEAKRRAEEDFARDPADAAERAGRFAGLVEGMTGVRDPRRVGNLAR